MASKKELSLGELVNIHGDMDGKSRGELFFDNTEPKTEKINKKRSNKNRPREQSSKIPVKPLLGLGMKHGKELQRRDPRFDSLCGTYNEKFFKDTYNFLDDIKQKEKHELQNILKEENDPERKEKIKFLLKRIKDQETESERKELNLKKKMEQRDKIKKKLLIGERIHFKTKSEKKLSDLVDKYEELKSKGKVQSYMKKKIKKEKKVGNKMPFM